MQQPPYQPPDWTQLNKQPVSRQAGSVPPPAQLEPEYQAPQVPGGYAPAQPGYAPQPGPYAPQRQKLPDRAFLISPAVGFLCVFKKA